MPLNLSRSSPPTLAELTRIHWSGPRPSRRPLHLAAALLVLAASAAHADSDWYFDELPIVASISRLPQRQADAPSSVTVIDRETIKASGVRSLSDVFRLVPGFQTFASSDVAARVTYHGVTDEDFSPRVQVLVDGRSLHSPLFLNGMNWALVPVALEDIERIEVVRGSNTVSYGANAFLGVINIITVDPALVRGASVAVNRGNQKVRDHTLRAGRALGEHGNLRLTYQQLSDDGLDHTHPRSGDRDWRDRNLARLLDVAANYQLGLQDLLELSLGRVEGERLTGRLDDETWLPKASDPLRELEETSTWLQLRWLHTLSETADFSLRYTYGEDTGDAAFVDARRPPGFDRVNEHGDRGTRHEIEAVNTLLPAANTRLAWGASWRADTLHSDTMLRGKDRVRRDVGRVFANTEWKPQTWFTGNLGLSYEYDSLAGSHFAPRGSAAFHLTPRDTVRVGFARAWRSATTLDYRANLLATPTYAEWVGNRELPAERLDSWELAYLGDWRRWRMNFDVRVFREQLHDRSIAKIRTGEQPPGLENAPYTVEPVQDIRIRGYEFQWKWRPLENTRITVGHADIRIASRNTANGRRLAADPASNFSRSQARYVALAESSAPRRSTSLMLMQRLPLGIDLSLVHYRVGKMKWTRNTDVDAYGRTDVRIAYPFGLGAQRGEIAYTVQSLDGAHSEQREERTVERRHWVSLRVDF